MSLHSYLKEIDALVKSQVQKIWFQKLEKFAAVGMRAYAKTGRERRKALLCEFFNRARTEEIKAWYSSPEGSQLFQGTSISSLVIPHTVERPLSMNSIDDLEEAIANAYIALHHKHAKAVKASIMENIDGWLSQGLFYGVVLSSKIISQAFGLSVSYRDVVFNVGNCLVDPHEITSYSDGIRSRYFDECLRRIEVFEGLDLEQKELESSLVLADVSKPKIKKYKDKIILGPVRCNEIAALLSRHITQRIITKSGGKINPPGLTVVIYDTDTPFTYHSIMRFQGAQAAPVLPGLIVLGASGTIDAFRWLYAYRISLIAQKVMKSSLYSQTSRQFIPFIFYGVLVPRDAEILLDMKNLHMLRYRGNIDPRIEFAYLMQSQPNFLTASSADFDWKKFRTMHS